VIDTRDNKIFPSKGILWDNKTIWSNNMNDNTENFTHIETDFNIYFSFKKPNISVLALRFGGAINTGNYNFFFANTLGGKSNLRGYRHTRFTGDKSLYQNSEFRFKLYTFKNYLFTGQFGIHVFHDIGRVWLHENDNSQKWHQGYGTGIWLAPFDRIVVRASFQKSSEDQMIEVNAGYFF